MFFRLLLDHDKTLVNCRDLQGLSPLLKAAELGKSDIVTALLDAGANVSK